MKASLRIGKIAGVEIGLDYSWFIIFFLVTWSLAAYNFPNSHPGWPATLYWILGVFTSILFFGSVLAHEMAHSLVARSTGVPVRNITLFIFGGAAHLSREPRSARDEFLMALAGPATSLGIGAVFGLSYFAVRTVSEPLAALTGWLSAINFILALFNLIPGFPLDGGRVLRAIIWAVSRNLKTATQIATIIGRAIAFLFIFAGIWMIFKGNWPNGLWTAFIGWFLENAASSSYRQLALKDMLQGHTAKEIMNTDCPSVSKTLTLVQLVHDYILPTTRRCFPVVDGGSISGIITLHNVKEIPKEMWSTTSVADAMIPAGRMITVKPDDGLFEVFEQLTSEDVNQLPVLENGNVVGMVARDTVLAFIRAKTELGI